MAYGNKPYSKSPLPTGDFKSSNKRLVAHEEDGIITLYYEAVSYTHLRTTISRTCNNIRGCINCSIAS